MTKRCLTVTMLGVWLAVAGAAAADRPAPRRNPPSAVAQELQQRIERVLDRWCRWLSGFNSICVPDDVKSDRVIGGKPLKERVKGANFEPGGIQEHHGFYHPGYMGWPLALQAYAEMMDQMLPEAERNPDVYLHNWRLAFDRLKQGMFANGRFIHCAGDDWNAYGYGNDHILPIGLFAGASFRDRDAVRLASEWLALAERQQALTGGPIQGSRLARLQHDYHNDFAWYEAISGATLACALWVLEHTDTSALPPPATAEQYNARNVGTYDEPNARLVWCRDRHRWASCSWRSAYGEWQAIVQPIALPHLLKFNHNSTGILQVAGGVPTKKNLAHRTRPLDGGFWSLGTIERAATAAKAGKPLVRQHQALVALPEGPSVFVDPGPLTGVADGNAGCGGTEMSFDGLMSDVRLCNRARSAAEVAVLARL